MCGLRKERPMIRKTGTVKWFNNEKGFGFIVTADENEDIFVHYSQLAMEGFKQLKANQAVEFIIIPNGEKGVAAGNVSIL